MNRPAFRVPGFVVLLVFVGCVAAAAAGLAFLPETALVGWAIAGVLGSVAFICLLTGLVVVNPNEAKVIQFFGRYVGTLDKPGFWFTYPLSSRQVVSLRVRNFETTEAKVNDADGNPVEIAAVIVWKVTDPAKAVFSVDSYKSYVSIQSESALRHLATCYPYDSLGSERMSLRDGPQVSEELTEELRERVTTAGISIVESRITHLAYAPEIAQAMLRRQQASAVVSARRKIVDGAIGMVEMALEHFDGSDMVALDDERKAAMVSNLLVVLCSDHATQPVVNTGSLYT